MITTIDTVTIHHHTGSPLYVFCPPQSSSPPLSITNQFSVSMHLFLFGLFIGFVLFVQVLDSIYVFCSFKTMGCLLISFLGWSLPVYRNITDFYKLILGPTSFLNSEVLTDFFLNSSLFSIYNVISYANRESFTYFPIWKSFISFCCSIELARTPRTTLNRRDILFSLILR